MSIPSKRHSRMNSEGQKSLQASLSALALIKRYGDLQEVIEDNQALKKVRSSTMPPHLANVKAVFHPRNSSRNESEHRRQIFSEKSHDLEATMFLIQQKNSRNLNKCFKGSVYSLQDTLKFHMAVDKANSSTLTMSKVGIINTPPVSVTPSVTVEYTPSIKSFVFSNLSSQSLTLIEAPPSIVDKTNFFTPIIDLDQPIYIKSISNTNTESNFATSSVESETDTINKSFDIIQRKELKQNRSESSISEPHQQTISRFSTYLVEDEANE